VEGRTGRPRCAAAFCRCPHMPRWVPHHLTGMLPYTAPLVPSPAFPFPATCSPAPVPVLLLFFLLWKCGYCTKPAVTIRLKQWAARIMRLALRQTLRCAGSLAAVCRRACGCLSGAALRRRYRCRRAACWLPCGVLLRSSLAVSRAVHRWRRETLRPAVGAATQAAGAQRWTAAAGGGALEV